MKDESKYNNQQLFLNFDKNKKNKKKITNLNPSKIQFLMKKNERTINKNSDLIFLNDNIRINLNSIEEKKDEDKFRTQSIGVNTSKHDKKRKTITKNIKNIKSKVNMTTKPYSDLFKKYFIFFEENKHSMKKPKSLKNNKIPKLDLQQKKKFLTISSIPKKKNIYNIFNRTIPINKINKESLLTYNFNKDAYYKEQRKMLNYSNNDFSSIDNIFVHNRLKKTKTNKNLKTLIFSNIDLKNMSNKNKKNKRFKLFNKTNLFHEIPTNDILMEHSVNKDIKNSFCNALLKNAFSNEDKKIQKIIDEQNNLNKEEILKLMEYPDSVFGYIVQKLKEYNTYNQRNGFRKKLDKMKIDLKLTEQRALYELINLKYDRVPGDEINIKTNLFCVKNKNLHL